ncbi:MAG: apolipoprotein N-acyltransferase [Pseudomonadota bacterium]
MSQAAAMAQNLLTTRPIFRYPAMAGIGALAALGQAPWELWPLTIGSMALLFGLFLATESGKQAAVLGLVSGIGYFALALNWIVEPFFVDLARHGWMAPFAIVLLSIGMGLFWAAPFWLARLIGAQPWPWIGGMIAFEWLRGVLFTGFPWAQLGHVLIASPLLHWASYGGVLLLVFLVLFGSVSLWYFLSKHRMAGCAGLLFLMVLLFGGVSLKPQAEAASDAPVVRLVQPNVPQHEKWDRDKIPGFFQRMVSFTAEPGEPDLVVWPENSVVYMLEDAGPAIDLISDAAGDAPVVIGVRRSEGRRFYNSMALIDGAGQISATYDKHHLVPFGEFMPFGSFLARFGIFGLAAEHGSGFSAGPGSEIIEMGELGNALPLICYEGVFARNLLSAPDRPDMLLMITNDAWFGEASGPYQHLAQARLRSVEMGLPMIRVANTGISAMIDAAGNITGSLALNETGFLDLQLPPALPATVYSRVGDWPMILFALLMVFVSGLFTRSVQTPS